MTPLVERELIHKLEGVVAGAVWAIAVTDGGEAANGNAGCAAEAGRAAKFDAAQAEFLHDVAVGDGVFGGLKLRPAQISELELVDGGGSEDVGVGDGARHLPLVVEGTVSGQVSWREGVGIGDAVAGHQGVFGRELMVAAQAEEIVVAGAGAAVEEILHGVAVGAAAARDVGVRHHAGKVDHVARHRVEAADGDHVTGEEIADKDITDQAGGAGVIDAIAGHGAAQCVGTLVGAEEG